MAMALKGRRDYKADMARKEEQAMVEAFVKDMKEQKKAKSNKEYKAQVKEFGSFLTDEMDKPNPFPFLVDMKARLDEGTLLTENMVTALRKCKDRKKPKSKGASEDYPTITLKVKPFFMKVMELDSRIITGKVKGESPKAWLIEGHADMLDGMSFCVRCGKELKEPASMVTGMGRICAEKAGVPYDPTEVLNASKSKRTKVRNQFIKKLHNQKFERWIPKSQAEIYEGDK